MRKIVTAVLIGFLLVWLGYPIAEDIIVGPPVFGPALVPPPPCRECPDAPRTTPSPGLRPLRPAEPGALRCAHEATVRSGTLAAGYEATVAYVRDLPAYRASPDRWPDTPDTEPALLCYVDARFPVAGWGGEAADRAIVAVVRHRAELILAGPHRTIPLPLPPDRR